MNQPTPRTPPAGSLAILRRLVPAWLLLAALLVPGLAGPAARAAAQPTERQLKATLLFNLLKFTEWPKSAFTNAAAPLVIGILGDDPFGVTLDLVVQDESVRGRSLVVHRFAANDDPSACHLLFISRSEKDRLAALWPALRGHPVLTVGDLPEFCQLGGMINLALSPNGTIRPEIDPAAARAAGLEISSRLLGLPMVRLVKTKP
jgi:hypothetical protein